MACPMSLHADGARGRMTMQMVDSKLETTRVFWRKKFFNVTDAQAADPRPFIEVLWEDFKATQPELAKHFEEDAAGA